MQASVICMHKSSIQFRPIHVETRFRSPTPVEQTLRFWVDRIGSGPTSADVPPFRILGQFAVVAVEEGAGRLHIAGQNPQRVQAGDVIVVHPQIATRYHAEPSWFTRWIVWNGEAAGRLAEAGLLNGHVRNAAARPVRAAFLRLVDLMQVDTPVAALERQSVILHLVTELAAGSTPVRNPEDPSARVRACAEELGRTYDRDYSIHGLAQSAGLSDSQFRRLFRRQTGQGPAEFLRTTRIARAKELLLQGVRIKEVAEQTGFRDVFYFMRAFKQVAGVAPGRFVQLHGWAAEAG
jgi:AraC-like DNA-binding protein